MLTPDIIRYVFNVCIGVGFAIPLFSLLIGTFGSMFDVDIDIDTDAELDAPVPFNMMSLCFALILFGAFGRYSMRYMNGAVMSIIMIILLITFSLLGYVVFYRTIILRMKANSPTALNYRDLIGKTGILTLKITDENDGTISVLDSTGAKISYRARAAMDKQHQDNVLNQGERVVVVDFNIKENTCYVERIHINKGENNA